MHLAAGGSGASVALPHALMCPFGASLFTGKSTLLYRLVHGRYRPGLPPTYGAEFGAKRVRGMQLCAFNSSAQGLAPARLMLPWLATCWASCCCRECAPGCCVR